MSSPVDRMKKLISFLPQKDIKLAEKFINTRDFESLQELVDSARYKVKKSQSSEQPKEEYTNIDLEKLSELKGEVDTYILSIFVPDTDEDDSEVDYYDLEDIV